MTEKTSNISPIVQNSITKEKLSKANNYLEQDKDSLEPVHNLDNTEYGKVIVHEYVKKDGVIHIIDNSGDNFRVYEILPNGSYSMKSAKSGDVTKTNGDNLTIINGDMTLKINNGSLSINVGGDDNSTMERVVSFDKLKDKLDEIITNITTFGLSANPGALVTYTTMPPIIITEDEICYDNIEINTDA